MPNLTKVLTVTGIVTLSLLAVAGPPEGWHTSLQDGLDAARVSGRPLLVVTLWGDGI